jgi:hypothetical protein
MAITLTMNYTKKLGLPQFSSHACSISVQVEISDLGQVATESRRLYDLLQTSVDAQMQQVGYMPDVAYGIGDNNGFSRGASHQNSVRGNGHNGSSAPSHQTDRWNCTDGQRGLILRVVHENKLDKEEVEAMARQLFQVGVRECNKLQASQLIEELLEKTGRRQTGRGSRWRDPQPARG